MESNKNMNVKNSELVLVKGVDDFCDNNLCHLFDGFYGPQSEIPKEDAYYVAM